MRYVLTILSVLASCLYATAQINYAEYFIGNDPGYGKGTAIPISTPQAAVDLDFQVALGTYEPGVYRLHVRMRDNNGMWSQTASQSFIVRPSQVIEPATHITYAEYFIGRDPGYGKGTAVPIGAPGAAVDFGFDVGLDAYEPGFYRIHVRTKDDKGMWSQTTAQPFLIMSDRTVEKIVAFHYHITGAGLATEEVIYTLDVPASDVAEALDIDLTALPGAGDYVLHIYASSEAGARSHVSTWPFTIGETLGSEQNITFPEISTKQYGDGNFSPAASASSGLEISYASSDASIARITETGQVQILKPGQVTITARQGGNTEFEPADEVNRTLTITKAPLTVTASSHERVYRQANPAFSLTYTGFVNNDGASVLQTQPAVSTVANQQSNVGTYAIVASGAVSDRYEISYANGTLTIAPAVRTLTFNALPATTYGSPAIPLTASVNTGEVISFHSSNTDVATITANNTLTIQGAGTATITASVPENSNYTGARTVQRQLTVGKTAQTITFANISSKQYGDAAFNLNASASSGLAVSYSSSDETVARVASNGQVQILKAGQVTITASQAGNAAYEAATNITRSFTIAKAPLTITAPSHTRKYGEANPTLNAVYSGFVNNDGASVLGTLPAITTVATAQSPVGTYPIVASGAASDHYAISYANGTLTVTPAERILEFAELPMAYYGSGDIQLHASVNTGETITFQSSNTAVATVAANNTLVIRGVGTAVITASVPANSNYTGARSVSRELRVDKATQTIALAQVPILQRRGDDYIIQASSDAGLPVDLVLSDQFTASLNGQVLTPLRVGRAYLTASQAGNEYYHPATPVTVEVVVTDEKNSVVRVHPAVSPDGDGINDVLIIEGIADYPDNRISVFSANGVLVYDAKNYDNEQIVFDGKGKNGNVPQGTYYYVLQYETENGSERKTGYFVLRY